MAKKKPIAKKGKGKNQAKGKKGLGWQGRFIAICILVGMLGVMPSTILFTLGILPTMVAIYVDKDPKKMSGFSIGALNVAPIIAYIILLWERGHNMENAMVILTNPTTLMVIYFCAWMGWIIHFIIPPLVAELVKKNATARLKKIKQEQAKIIKAWGDDVRGIKPVEKKTGSNSGDTSDGEAKAANA